jgi:hypothetical protein
MQESIPSDQRSYSPIRTQVMHDLVRYTADRNQDIQGLNGNIECCHTMINYSVDQIERQTCQFSEQEKEIREGKDRTLVQRKRNGYLEALLVGAWLN